MAVKTFTSGEVLTASDTNTYLANAGLVHVKSQTIGTGVASVTVTNAFNSTYDNYFVQVSGGVGSTAQAITFRLGASTASYYSALWYVVYATAAGLASTVNNGSGWSAGESSTNFNSVCITIQNPNVAKFTHFTGGYMGTVGGWVSGYHGVATAYTDFTILVGGTMTGGTIDVYGYRKG